MRNLSPLGAIHSPIDADRDATAYRTDFAKLGLPDRSPFDILAKQRAPATPHKTPKKRGPKPKRSMAERAIASLRDPKPNHFNSDIMTREESDRTQAIRGATC